MAVMLIFILSSGQADNLVSQEKESCRYVLLAEALVEYPFGWFFALDEMEEIYEVEYRQSDRLQNFIRYENGKYLSQCDTKPTEIPGQFVKTTLELLNQLLERKHAKYLFRLDTFHGHFFVAERQFEKKYRNLNTEQMMSVLVNDDSLGVLFHCAEHMALRNPPQTGIIDKEAQELIEQRNIIGWYGSKSMEIVRPEKNNLVGSGKSNTATIPRGFHGVGSITFMANINGEFSIKHAGQTIRLDISLCDYYYY